MGRDLVMSLGLGHRYEAKQWVVRTLEADGVRGREKMGRN